jgi:30S ribosomal protein S31
MADLSQHLSTQGVPMGKGDTKTRRGKTYRGNYGNVRPHKAAAPVAGQPATKSAVKKTAVRKNSA